MDDDLYADPAAAGHPERKSPWPLVMGIIILVLGAFSVLFMLMEIGWVAMFDMQRDMMKNIHEAQASYRGMRPSDAAAFREMQKMFDFPRWYLTFTLISALAGSAVRVAYSISAILMIMRRPIARPFYMAMAAVIIIHDLLRIVAIVQTESFMLYSGLFGPIFGIFIEAVLLTLVAIFVKPTGTGARARLA